MSDANRWIDRVHVGDCRELLDQMAIDGIKVQTCVTSPPYFWLRDYGMSTSLGRHYIGCELNPAYRDLAGLRGTTLGMLL